MVARSTTRSNQRPDTLMQDRIRRIEETSCNARPDHTLGSYPDLPWGVACPLPPVRTSRAIALAPAINDVQPDARRAAGERPRALRCCSRSTCAVGPPRRQGSTAGSAGSTSIGRGSTTAGHKSFPICPNVFLHSSRNQTVAVRLITTNVVITAAFSLQRREFELAAARRAK